MKVRMLQDEVGLDVSSKDLLRQAWKHDASNLVLLRGWGERTRASSGWSGPLVSGPQSCASPPLCLEPSPRRAAAPFLRPLALPCKSLQRWSCLSVVVRGERRKVCSLYVSPLLPHLFTRPARLDLSPPPRPSSRPARSRMGATRARVAECRPRAAAQPIRRFPSRSGETGPAPRCRCCCALDP